MIILYKEPKKKFETIQINTDNQLADLQKLVGGYIEVVRINNNHCVICNEEGRLEGLPNNTTINGIDFVGNICIVGSADGDFCDVSAEMIEEMNGCE